MYSVLVLVIVFFAQSGIVAKETKKHIQFHVVRQ